MSEHDTAHNQRSGNTSWESAPSFHHGVIGTELRSLALVPSPFTYGAILLSLSTGLYVGGDDQIQVPMFVAQALYQMTNSQDSKMRTFGNGAMSEGLYYNTGVVGRHAYLEQRTEAWVGWIWELSALRPAVYEIPQTRSA